MSYVHVLPIGRRIRTYMNGRFFIGQAYMYIPGGNTATHHLNFL
jgi:hypothetical protein